MGFVWKNNDLDKMETHLQSLTRIARAEADRIVGEVVDEASWDMIGFIESRGTGYRGHRGRVETGYMAGDVADTKGENEIVGDRVTGKFGWGVHGVPAQDYYLYQEQGFKNWRTGRDVPPMHALLDAFVKARINLAKKLAMAVKK